MVDKFGKVIFLLLIVGLLAAPDVFGEDNALSKDAKKLASDIAKEKKDQYSLEKEMFGHFYKEGVSSYKKGDYNSSLDNFARALEIDPGNKSAKSYIAKIRRKIESQTSSKSAAESDVSKIRSFIREGKVFYGEGEYDKALESFGNALSLDPENKDASTWAMKTKRAQIIKDENFEKKELKKDFNIATLEKENVEQERMLEVEKGYLPPEKPLKRKIEVEELVSDAETKEEEARIKLLEELQKKIVPAVSLADADIRDVIRQLMDMTGVTIVIDEKALSEINQGAPLKLTFNTVTSMPLLDLLNIALKTSGLNYRLEPTYIWISTPARLQEENLITKTYKLKYGVRRIRKVELEKFESKTSTSQ